VVGTAVLGEDEHRGPVRFLGRTAHAASGERCAPQQGLFERPRVEQVPGALLQIAAIQSAASEQRVTLAPSWLRLAAGPAWPSSSRCWLFATRAPSLWANATCRRALSSWCSWRGRLLSDLWGQLLSAACSVLLAFWNGLSDEPGHAIK